jgi:hypothetical protein
MPHDPLLVEDPCAGAQGIAEAPQAIGFSSHREFP